MTEYTAGRNLDRVIATRVMRRPVDWAAARRYHNNPAFPLTDWLQTRRAEYAARPRPAPYSTDAHATALVVWQMQALGYAWEWHFAPDNEVVCKWYLPDRDTLAGSVTAHGATWELAVCRAALQALDKP